MQWNLLTKATTPGDNFTMAVALGMLVVDSVIYLLITWYVDAVNPGEYGMPQKWYFPFQVRSCSTSCQPIAFTPF